MFLKKQIKSLFFNNKKYNFIHTNKKEKINEKIKKNIKIVKESLDKKYYYTSEIEGYFFEEMIDIIANKEGKKGSIFVYDDLKNKSILIGFANLNEKTEIIKLKKENEEKIVDKIISILKVYSYKSHIYFIVDKIEQSKEYEFLLLYIESFFFFNGQEIIDRKKFYSIINELPYNATIVTKFKKYIQEYGKILLLSLIWLLPLVSLNEYIKTNIVEEIKFREKEIKEIKEKKLKIQKKILFLNKEKIKKSKKYEGVRYE